MSVDEPLDLADTFATIARELEAAGDPAHTQHIITRRAVETVPGCAYAGITLVRRHGSVSTVAPTHAVAERIHEIQNELGEGPCLSAIADHPVYTVDNLHTDHRWPRFADRVAAEYPSVASMLSFRLFTSEDTTGALDLYADRPHAFTERSRTIGTVLSAHAAIAMLAAREHERVKNLEIALTTNRTIGIAIGIVMHTTNVNEDRAFEFLVSVSQRLNYKLHDVAKTIVASGGVPSRFVNLG